MAAEASGAALLRRQASREQRKALAEAVTLASDLGTPLFLVGGVIRDLLLTGQLRDIDVVVEGAGCDFGRKLAARLRAEVRVHERFHTAEIVAGGLRIDVAAARRETYPRPAALPVVEPGTIDEDLARRDFTINAMALRLWPEGRDELLDPFNGRLDMDRRRLRVLQERSFHDDPTRILRGARLAARLGFGFESTTRAQIAEALATGAFEPLSGSRLRQELVLLLEEEASVDAAADLLADLGAWTALHPSLTPGAAVRAHLRSVTSLRRAWATSGRDEPSMRWWLIRLTVLVEECEPATRAAVADRLGIEGALRAQLVDSPSRLEPASRLLRRKRVKPHEIARVCREMAPEELALLALADATHTSRRIESWLDELRHVRLGIGGGDLVARGFPEGPTIGRALAATLEARLDGIIDESQELDFALGRLTAESQQPCSDGEAR